MDGEATPLLVIANVQSRPGAFREQVENLIVNRVNTWTQLFNIHGYRPLLATLQPARGRQVYATCNWQQQPRRVHL